MGKPSEEDTVRKLSPRGQAAFRADQDAEVARHTAEGLKYSSWVETSWRLANTNHYQSM